MQQRTVVVVLAAGLGLAALAGGGAWAAGATGNLMQWTMQTTEHMQGAPSLAPRTVQRKLCAPVAGQFSKAQMERALQRANARCRIENYRQQGKTVTFDQTCTVGGQTLTSHGVFHEGPGVDFTGSTHSALHIAGRAMTVDVEYAGKKVGSCDYRPKAAG
ncbi:MAG: DUF3617 family protein [Rhodanobacteraceae bacterium]|nr:MAG: DUF3617 family protein [Rhodanobacteraceae bacterium]